MKASQAAVIERASRMHQLYKLLKDAEEDEETASRPRSAAHRRA